MLRLTTFGNLTIERDGRPVTSLASRKAEALLVYLAANPRPHSRELLTDLLWDDRTQKQAQANLRVVLSSLRKEVGEFVDITRETAGVRPEAKLWLDVAQLEATLQQRLSAATVAEYEAAVALYQGEFLEGFFVREASGFEAWQVRERERLHRLALDGLQRLVDQALTCGNYAAGTGHANRLLELEPLSETAHRQLMELLARAGQREQALAQYEQCQTVLWEELGIEPAAETEALAEAVRAGNVGPGPQAGGDGRLVTILGPGGSGKTRLALAAAERLLAAADGIPCPFPDGAYFVPLAAVDDPAEIPAAIARAMGIRELETEPAALRQQVLRILEDKRLLLVLDNFEQLVEGASWLSEVLQAAGEVRLLVTSRARLKLRAEQLFALGGLPYTEWQSPAEAEGWSSGQLFCQAARQVWPDFWLDDNIGALYEICRLVDGLPLALELAAGWVGLLSPPEIAAEIQRGIDLLAAELADLPERHRSIQALMDSTWQRLSPDEQQILGRLSVFRGGFTRQAAAAVAGADLSRLIGLANQSLIQPQPGRERYDMHPLLRQYVRGRLDGFEQEAALHAHCAYFCNWIGELTPDLWLAMPATLEAVESDLRNVRQAWEQAVDQADFVNLDQAAVGLYQFYLNSDRTNESGAKFVAAAGSLADRAAKADDQRVQAKLLACAPWSYFSGCTAVPEERQALAIIDELSTAGLDVRADRAFALGRLARELGYAHWSEANERMTESCDLCRQLSDWPQLAANLCWLGWYESARGSHDLAVAYAQEAHDLYQRSGAVTADAYLKGGLGGYLLRSGQVEAGEQRWAEGLQILRAAGNERLLADFLVDMSKTLIWSGRPDRGYEVSREAYDLNRRLFERSRLESRRILFFASALQLVAALAALGWYAEADIAIRDLEAEFQEWPNRNYRAYRPVMHAYLCLARGQSAEAQSWLDQAEVPGYLGEVVGEGAIWRSLQAATALAEGHPGRARDHLLAFLEPAVAEENILWLPQYILPSAALWMASQGRIERGVELWARALEEPGVAYSQLSADVAGRPVEEAARQLPPEIRAAAEARGRELDLRETAAALLEELKAAAGD